MSKNNKRQKEILAVAISAFLITAIWLIFNWYNTVATSTVSQTLSVQIVPITPTFDQTTIDSLRKRNAIDSHFRFTQASPTPSPTPSVTAPTTIPSPISNQATVGQTVTASPSPDVAQPSTIQTGGQ